MPKMLKCVRSDIILLGLILSFSTSITQAKTVQYTFRVSYISGAPDGVWTNNILGINGHFPGPCIEAEAGDTLKITVINNIQNGQNTTLHWHGILQRGTPFEDGPSEITQCPIKFGKRQVYRFAVPLSGTYWYHSHVNSQYTEGLWGVMIVRAKQEVWRKHYDEEILITLSDWYHTSGLENDEYLLHPSSGGAPPYPSSVLINGMGRYPCAYALAQKRHCFPFLQSRQIFRLQLGKTYRLRVVNTAGWTAFNFTVDGHTLRTIEVDGVDTAITDPHDAVFISAGQRYSFLLTIPSSGHVNCRFLFRANTRTEFLFTRPGNINPYPEALFQEVTGSIIYSRSSSSSKSTEQFVHDPSDGYETDNGQNWKNLKFLNELSLIPYDRVEAPHRFDTNVELNILFFEDSQGIRRGSFNLRPAQMLTGVPQLAKLINNKTIPETMFPVYVKYGDIVQVVINNPELGTHPVHLHGHHFWVMGSGKTGDGNYNANKHRLHYTGLRRDTVLVHEESWLVIRFKADNVGVWTLHCHIDWHLLTGMLMTFVEAPELAHTLTIPSEARKVCADHGIVI